MASNHFHPSIHNQSGSTHAGRRVSSSLNVNHQMMSSGTTEEPSSTFTDTSQGEARPRGPVSSNQSSNLDSRLGALRNNTVYLAVHARSLPGSYHYGLFIPRYKETHQGLGWTVIDDQGGWNEKLLSFDAVFDHSRLLLLHRVAQIHEGREALCEQKLRTLRADGTSSENRVVTIPESSRLGSGPVSRNEHNPTPNGLDSMARVKQAMRTLLDSKLITVSADRAETWEDDVPRLAGQIWDQVICHKMQALVT